MDSYPVEQVVKKEKSVKYYLNVVLIIVGAIAIPGILIALAYIISLPYLIYLALFAFLFCIYGVWFFITSLRVEYEYAFLSSVFRVDKVISRRKRRPVVKVDVKMLEDLFPYSDEKMSEKKFAKVYNVAAREFSTDNYVAVYHSEAKGRTAIVFTPNEKMLEAMKPYFNNNLRKKLFLEASPWSR